MREGVNGRESIFLRGPPLQGLLSSLFILDALADEGAAVGPLDVDCVHVSLVALLEGDAVLEGEAFWAFEEVEVLDIGAFSVFVEHAFSDFGEVLFALGELGDEVGVVAVLEGGGRHAPDLGVGVRSVVRKLVVIHVKIILNCKQLLIPSV